MGRDMFIEGEDWRLWRDKVLRYRRLLEKAHVVLQDHWFYGDGTGETYNNDDVIEMSEEIKEALKS